MKYTEIYGYNINTNNQSFPKASEHKYGRESIIRNTLSQLRYYVSDAFQKLMTSPSINPLSNTLEVFGAFLPSNFPVQVKNTAM